MKILFAILLLTTSFSAFSQGTDSFAVQKQNVRSATNKMGELFTQKNYDEYMSYVHPRVIEMMRGKEQMKKILSTQVAEMEKQGFTFKSMTAGDSIVVVREGNELQALVQQVIQLKAADGTLKQNSWLIAFSPDNGKTWRFVDTSAGIEKMKQYFTLSNKLTIPPKQKPVLIPD